MTIYFDMDGTIAGLFDVPSWKQSIDAGSTAPYEVAKPLYNRADMDAVIADLTAKGYKIGIITYVAFNSTKAYANTIRKVKKAWLKANFPYATEVHMIDHKTPKWSVAKDHNSILVDDCRANRDAWKWGKTVNAYKADLVAELKKI